MTSKFLCGACGFSAAYDYLGSKPPFCKSIVLLEEAYIMKDPFTEKHNAVVLGSHCTLCKQAVCVDQDCSLFYTRRFCLDCVRQNLADFPEEIQSELRKKDKT